MAGQWKMAAMLGQQAGSMNSSWNCRTLPEDAA
jgi:hypothetical protein